MFRAANGEFGRIDLDNDVLDFGLRFVLVCRDEVDRGRETLPVEDDTASLESVILMPDFPKGKRNVSHIGLHPPESESEFVVMIVRDRRVRREPDAIVGFDVGEEVASRHGDDLDDEVERIIQCAGWVCSRHCQQV